ncbi:acyl-CoA dehydrogenase family protein [Nocardiopsis sp. JB363]|uniref:acyl-CoA dehydrogenase family protein n=1 Tax=Nocardiopsis sp. JB363 TaxID=1434837 RepID=UPI00097A35AB|nr:acyl-CoA dehydrogenase family protein [Nocardiopsis sp. JB363]SIO86134.1 acyl-CoA dehydrogenase [Nocardiopsis sp. JB363]
MPRALTDEQRDLVESINRFCQNEFGTKDQRDALTDHGREPHSQTVYDKMADLGWLGISMPEERVWDRALNTFWDPFVAVREGVLDRFPGTSTLYWTFDEFLRRAMLLFLSELQPISIEIPTTNNPDY